MGGGNWIDVKQKQNPDMSYLFCLLLLHRRKGEAITLVTRADWRIASELIDILKRGNQVT